jgi:uncharacterized membrane protein
LNNPVNMVLLVIAVPLLAAVGRWQIGRDRWAKYPGGQNGYFKDCLLASLGLFGICAGCAAYSLMPAGQQRNIAVIVLFGAGVLYSFFPLGRGANIRLLQARYQDGPQAK